MSDSPAASSPAPLASRLARLRVPLGFVSALIVLWLAQPTRTTLAAGSLVALVGEALRIWAAGHLHKSREVTSSGPYRWLAHPLYVGSSVMALGLAIAAGRLLVGVTIAAYMGVTTVAAIKHEEAFLRGRFGPAYDTYRRGVASDRPFSLAQAMANREYRAALGLVAAVLLLLWKAAYNGAL